MKTRPASIPRQRGAALIVALLFLIALTLLGTTGATNNTLQERMAGNTRNRDVAFQAAEHALADAHSWFTGDPDIKNTMDALVSPTSDCNRSDLDLVSNDGIRPQGECHANDANYWRNTFDWTSSDLRSPTTNVVAGVASPPVYVIEKVPGYTDTGTPPVAYDLYRVTARGVGGVADAVVILQTMYRLP